MKIYYLLLLCILSEGGFARGFYFSTTIGDDSRSVTTAQNPATPWKSLQKLNSFFSSLMAGDRVFFRRGDVFPGFIDATKSGSVSAPIVCAAYGDGKAPVISGFATLNSWTNIGTNIWKSTPLPGTSPVNLAMAEGKIQPMGRYPNADAPNGGFLSIDSHTDNIQIKSAAFTSTADWAGAEVVMRKNRWILDRNTITASSLNTINYTSSTFYYPTNKFGFFIQNNLKALDQNGEWYFDAATRNFYVYSSGSAPADVMVPIIDRLVNVYKQNNLVFTGLTFEGANKKFFDFSNCTNIKLLRCSFSYGGENGIESFGTSGLTIDNCLFQNINNVAIKVPKSAASFDIAIENNHMRNIGIWPGMGQNEGSYSGITLNAKKVRISHNEIINTGYLPISFTGDSVAVERNFIDSFALIKDDAGGIYTFRGTSPVCVGRTITENIVVHGIGAGAGTDNPTYLPANGIYIDDNSANVTITSNTVADCSNYGIYLHNAHEIDVFKNTIYNNRIQLYMSHDNKAEDIIRNCLVKENVFFSKMPTQFVSSYASVENDLGQFGDFDNNFYGRPLNPELPINTRYNAGVQNHNRALNLIDWQQSFSKDNLSVPMSVWFPFYKINSTDPTNLVPNGTFNTNISGCNCYSGSSCGVRMNTTGVLDGNSLEISTAPVNGATQRTIVTMNAGSVKAGQSYTINFSLRGLKEDHAMAVYLRQTDAPYRVLTPLQYCKIETERTEISFLAQSSYDENKVSLVFEVLDDEENQIWIDNVQVKTANTSVFNPDTFFSFLYNNENSAKILPLDGEYQDVFGNHYDGSIALGPFSSVILMNSAYAISHLPAKFIRFKAQRSDNWDKRNLLSWELAQVNGVEKFYVEKSRDNTYFTTIDSLNAKTGQAVYSIKDNRTDEGIAFYRIKAFTKSLDYFYSTISSVASHEEQTKNTDVYYTADGAIGVNYYSPRKQTLNLALLNMNGQHISKQVVAADKGYNKFIVPRQPSTPSGVYILLLENNGTVSSTKVRL